jgi:hypothetical protein
LIPGRLNYQVFTDSANESWAGWAWSWVPSLLPISWNEDWSAEQHHAYAGQTYHIGFYVQQASVTFKVQKVFTFVTSIPGAVKKFPEFPCRWRMRDKIAHAVM